MADHMDRTAKQWLAARQVIADALREMTPLALRGACERNAEAILARLASQEPPILLCYPSELKE